MNAHDLAARLEELSAIDGPSQAAGAAVRDALGSGALKAALRGDWMGHALHPLLTDTVIGTWTSGLLLDLTRGQGADRLVAAGIICALPTALSGATDWADAEERDPGARRVGALHAVANVAALGPGGGDSKARSVARDVATDLRKAANEIEDRVSGGPKKRSAAARKAAQTRKRNAAQRSATARKAARTRARKT